MIADEQDDGLWLRVLQQLSDRCEQELVETPYLFEIVLFPSVTPPASWPASMRLTGGIEHVGIVWVEDMSQRKCRGAV
jgi:hypothetical protein